ncbi:hypothetical protein [uncultured Sphingomonas sp.]|uniref:hypothetical protein n=1 Tax=uncultured Sphingomonas sp. TaxID=158754 RepID=UPI00260387A8|nr:hypothetical protein [uncultured Sphingomonas sp.]
MAALRRLLRTCPALAALIVAAALLVRVLVPAGYMPTLDNGRIVIAVCSGYGPAMMAITIPGLDHHDAQDGDQAKSPCAFADLALPMIGGADPIQLAQALLFILAIALLLAETAPPRAAARLRPPLRGPPLIA